jgi:hypothetical protein
MAFSPVCIRVDMPPGSRLGTFFSEMRAWLRTFNIHVGQFSMIPNSRSTGCVLSFRTEDEARLFEQAFA